MHQCTGACSTFFLCERVRGDYSTINFMTRISLSWNKSGPLCFWLPFQFIGSCKSFCFQIERKSIKSRRAWPVYIIIFIASCRVINLLQIYIIKSKEEKKRREFRIRFMGVIKSCLQNYVWRNKFNDSLR